MATRSTLDITIYKRRDFTLIVYLRDLENNPLSLTDWSGRAQARENNKADSKLILDFTVTIEDAAAGKVKVFCSKENTNVCQSTGYWDLVLTNNEGKDDSYLVGNVTLQEVPTV